MLPIPKFIHILFFLILAALPGRAQQSFTSYLQQYGLPADTATLPAILAKAPPLPDASCYLISELHQVSANPILQFALIRYLNQHKQLKQVVLEMPHSMAVLYNHFLATGDTAFLRSIRYDGRYDYSFLRNIYQLNQSLPDTSRIRFTGVDIEIDKYRTRSFSAAMQLFLDKVQKENNTAPLATLLGKAATATTEREQRQAGKALLQYLQSNTDACRQLLGPQYPHLLLITGNNNSDRGRRDEEMYENFENACRILGYTPGTRFFASFGEAHIRVTNNKNTFRSFMEKSEWLSGPLKVSVIGVQYLNCYSSATPKPEGVLIANDGIIPSYLNKNNEAQLRSSIATYSNGTAGTIIIVPLTNTDNTITNDSYLTKLNWLLLVKGFAGLHKR